MLKIELSLALLVFICGLISIHGQACQTNEVHYNATSAPRCDRNCQDLSRNCSLTTERPMAGCYCRPGYARNLQRLCVPTNQCGPICPPNERPIWPRFLGCELNCQRTDNLLSALSCYPIRRRRCVCIATHCRNPRGQCEHNV